VKNNFFNHSVTNIYSKPSSNSDVSSQILYGEKFKILSKKNNWIKIKTSFDNYIGFIKKSNFNQNFIPTNKIFKLKSKIFKKINNKLVEAINIPARNIAFKTPDLITNSPPSSVKTTVVIQPKVFEYIAMSPLENPISL